MKAPLASVRVLEVATHVFVPISGAVLGEWGAELLKIEHPVTGDPYRGLVTQGLHKLHKRLHPRAGACGGPDSQSWGGPQATTMSL